MGGDTIAGAQQTVSPASDQAGDGVRSYDGARVGKGHEGDWRPSAGKTLGL